MAKVTAKFPLDKITGILGHQDRTVNIDGGLSCRIVSGHSPAILGVKTQATRTRTPGQIAQSATYCYCDKEWHNVPIDKHYFLGVYHWHIMRRQSMHMTNYLVWMRLCMSKAWPNDLFLNNSYVTSYYIRNTSGAPWTGQKIALKNVNVKRPDGTDVTVVQTSSHNVPITYLPHKIESPGTIICCPPDMGIDERIWIDVYSYGTYSSAQGCV